MAKRAADARVTLKGTNGNDWLIGTAFDNVISGRRGDDRLEGGFGNDLLLGGAGDDTLDGGDGNDFLHGGGGNDRFALEYGNDVLQGGDGMDTAALSFLEAAGPINFTLTRAVTVSTPWGIKTLLNIEAVELIGSEFADTIRGGRGDDQLNGLDGDDRLFGGAGADLLHGSLGNDTLTGGRGADIFYYSDAPPGSDVITDFSRAQGDKIHWLADADQSGRVETEWFFSGSAYRPDLGNQGQLVLTANGDGTYTLSAYYAWQTTAYAQVVINTSVTASDFVGVRAAPPPGATEGDDNFIGTAGNDVVDLLGGNDRYDGRDGDDIITGGAGRDILTGNGGSDVYKFNAVSDSPAPALTGDPETDHFNAVNAGDVILGFEDGADIIDLSSIDADTGTSGNQAFTLVDDFTGAAGELRIVPPAYSATFEFSGDLTLVQGDVDGDGKADFTISLGSYSFEPLVLTADDILF